MSAPASHLPRLGLAEFPTPLHPAARLSAELGGPQIWFKRDDLTGFGFGGNKIRSLDTVVADAVRQQADVLVTGGRRHSNHVRATLAVAAHLKLDAVAVLMGEPFGEEPPAGNLLLDRLFGGQLVRVPAGDPSAIDHHLDQQAASLHQAGRRPYVIGRGGASALGCAAYVDASFEIAHQARSLGFSPASLVCATGSCATQAGLSLGASQLESPFTVTGVTVSRGRSECLGRLRDLSQATARLLELSGGDPSFELVDDQIGPGYGLPSDACLEAIVRVARTEGLVLDPVYTGKAMAGLIEEVRRGRWHAEEHVIFLHSGGAPNLFEPAVAGALPLGAASGS